jgi:hypothetical protein
LNEHILDVPLFPDHRLKAPFSGVRQYREVSTQFSTEHPDEVGINSESIDFVTFR